jgi:transcriptional regulator with GAF, ATPase, and Fis domain
VAENSFREDLFYRLSVFPIRIPPLRERRIDIPALIEYFMHKKAKEIGLHFIPGLVPGAMERLMEYDWPGNVRELSNAVERAMIIHEGRPLSYGDIVGIQASKEEQADQKSGEGHFSLARAETQHIRKAMEMAGGKVEGPGGAAAILQMNPGTLRHRMRKFNIPFGKAVKPKK